MSSSARSCRVCAADTCTLFREIGRLRYWRCGACAATLLDEAQLPTRSDERVRYESHKNDVNDARYRTFLARLATPLLERLAPLQHGLDFGCGPAPALALMLREAGHEMDTWDPFFHSDALALDRTYDFITCTETAEHFHHPREEFDRLHTLLRPGGVLALMTTFQTDDARFDQWEYRRDPTHVTFYTERTMRVIAAQRQWACEIPAPNLVFMRRTV